MSETSPTEGGDDAGGEKPLPVNDQQPSADEQQTDSDSGGDTQGSDQDDSSQQSDDSTTDQDDASSDDEDGLTNFAKSQGIEDMSDLSEREKQLLKTAHDNQKAFRKTSQESEDLKKAASDANSIDDNELEDDLPSDAYAKRVRAEVAQMRAENRVTNFYMRTPDAREYDKEMSEIVVDEAQRNGKDAARYLASDLERLLVLARARRGDPTEKAREDGRREERQNLRNRQDGSAEGGQAQDSNKKPPKITRESISTMNDEDYKKLRESGELDAAIARGDLY